MVSKFEEWHSSQTHEAYDHRDCPHIEWEKYAWNAAIDEAVNLCLDWRHIKENPHVIAEAIKELKE